MKKDYKSRIVTVGDITLGGENPVRVQSMTTTDTRDTGATISQIKALENAGCEIIRLSVQDEDALNALPTILSATSIPLVADIHFNHLLAIRALEKGVDAVRINPGNIGGKEKTKEVLIAAGNLGKSIRIGVNAGSLERDLLDKHGLSADAIVESAFRQMEILESAGFTNYKVSLKASSVPLTVQAYTLFAEKSDVPLHVGVTEAGTAFSGTVKSAVGIGSLLLKGIGDTIRVSLTANPLEEVRAAWAILQASGVRKRGAEIISCPTCGRTEVELIALAEKVEKACAKYNDPVVIAVMGCAVNGPGEARHADYGIACGKKEGLIFAKGEIISKVPESKLLEELINIIDRDAVK